MHWLLCAEDSEPELREELARVFPGRRITALCAGLLEVDFPMRPQARLPLLAFCRQWLPDAVVVHAASINSWAQLLFQKAVQQLPDSQPWQLHVVPHYGTAASPRLGARAWHSLTRRGPQAVAEARRQLGRTEEGVDPEAGRHRCELIRERFGQLLREKRRSLLRNLVEEPTPFGGEHSLLQLWLTRPDSGCVSVATAPLPNNQRHLLSPFPKGATPLFSDKAAPSRAFAKLAEAEVRLGRQIQPGERCVDLGAAPGSWTYWAVSRGARVVAVDRAPLRADLQEHPRVTFQEGDAFGFRPAGPVDWLLCDVIAPPEQSAALLVRWVRQGWCRHFVVTLKLREADALDALEKVKRELAAPGCDLLLTKLCANKKEVCAFGSIVASSGKGA